MNVFLYTIIAQRALAFTAQLVVLCDPGTRMRWVNAAFAAGEVGIIIWAAILLAG